MSAFEITRTFGIMMAAIIAGLTSPASAASERSGKFAPASQEETIYRPECRIVQSDGTWLPSRRVECDW